MSKVTLEQMLEAGVHFGHQTFRWNPKMKPYIFDSRDGIHIIDLTKTEQKLKEALDYVAQLAKRGEILLLVGTKRQVSAMISDLGKEAKLPFVSERWPGGLLTNFLTIKGRINHLKQLRDKIAKGIFGDLTKKEIGILEKELADLERSFGGVDSLIRLPGAIFVTDIMRDKIAVREAIKLNIPVIALVDTNADPTGIDFVIPANDDAKNGVWLLTKAVVDAYVQNYQAATSNQSGVAVEAEATETLLLPAEAEIIAPKADEAVTAKASAKKKIKKEE